MELTYTKNGYPVFHIDGADLMFSSAGMRDDKYKYILFSKKRTTTVNTSGAKAKKKKTFTIREDVHKTFRMDLRSDTAPVDMKKVMSPILVAFLRKTIEKYTDENGMFHKKHIENLKEDIENQFNDPTDEWDDDPTADEWDDDSETDEF